MTPDELAKSRQQLADNVANLKRVNREQRAALAATTARIDRALAECADIERAVRTRKSGGLAATAMMLVTERVRKALAEEQPQ